jgi:hypothetical protein
MLLLLALTSVGLQAQTSVPLTTYTLHANELPKSHTGWTSSVEAPTVKTILAPDQALLVLLPQADGPWLLKRLTAWETANPAEQTLSFAAALPDKNQKVFSELTVDPNGKYLIVRFSVVVASNRKGYKASYSRHAILVVVDLASFTVVSRFESDDYLLTGFGIWRFSKDGLVIVTEAFRDSTWWPGVAPEPEHAVAALLSVPDLKSVTTCSYSELYHGADRSITDLGDDCPAFLKAANVASMDEIFLMYSEDRHYDNLAGKDCHQAILSDGGKYASYSCFVGHNYDVDELFYYETSRKYKVLSVPDGKPLLSISSVSLQSGTFATANGHDYLLVLRDNVKLEVYRLL